MILEEGKTQQTSQLVWIMRKNAILSKPFFTEGVCPKEKKKKKTGADVELVDCFRSHSWVIRMLNKQARRRRRRREVKTATRHRGYISPQSFPRNQGRYKAALNGLGAA